MRWVRRVLLLVVIGNVVIMAGLASLRWINPPTTAFMSREEGPVQYSWVDTDRMSEYLALAAVASEDQRFYRHWGIDPGAIETALEERAERGELRGASTITQQLVKNLFLSPARSLLRKVVEAYLAVMLDLVVSKERILELYLNVAEFGPGIYGVEAAARYYFGKSASIVSPGEAARLIAVLPSPRRSNPARPSEYLRERERWIVDQMFPGDGRETR